MERIASEGMYVIFVIIATITVILSCTGIIMGLILTAQAGWMG